MRLTTTIALLGLACNAILGQFQGGIGAGQFSMDQYEYSLSGMDNLPMYFGGTGSGEHFAEMENLTFDSQSLSVMFNGGNGRGDFCFSKPSLGLDTENLNLPFTSGPGRGDGSTSNFGLSLAGNPWGTLYAGATGRGDNQKVRTNLTFGDEDALLVFPGGLGRGDIEYYSFGEILNCTYYSIWTGSESTAWENPANWQCGELPNRYSDVFIPTTVPHFPYITVSPVEIRNLTLDNSSMLHVIGVPLNVLGGPQ